MKRFFEGSVSGTAAKMIFRSVLCAFVLYVCFTMTAFDAQSRDISDEVLRLHIIANSDSAEDQRIKLLVRDEIQKMCLDIYPEGCTKQQARDILEKKLPELVETARKTVKSQKCDLPVKGEIVNMYFTNRVYDDITLPAGNYDALRLTIGSGKGHNWWCVMFPPICVAASGADISDVLTDEQTDLVTSMDKYEYRFKLYELYEGLTAKIEQARSISPAPCK